MILGPEQSPDPHEAETAPAYSYSVLEATFEAAVEGILVVDQQNRVRKYNRRFVEIWGFSDALLEQGDNAKLVEEAVSKLANPDAFLSRLQQIRKEPHLGYRDRLELLDGRILERHARPLYDQGQLAGRISFFRDVTEDASARETFRRAKEAADAANRAKSVFLANMSHELRTPLNAIIGYCELILGEPDELPLAMVKSSIDKILSSGGHLLALINDVLDLSKIEANRMTISPVGFSLEELVRPVVDTVMPLAAANRNRLVVEVEPLPGGMYTDAIRLKQVLLNLLSNACKFTKDGQVTLNVKQAHVKGNAWVYFEVHDTGIGIHPDHIRELFQPFVQADPSVTRRYGGTGLGLSLSRRLCLLMKGDIDVISAPDRGSTFVARVPQDIRSQGHGAVDLDGPLG